MKPKKKCNHTSCRTLIDYDERYCDKHKGTTNKVYDQYREKKYKDFYNSRAWQKKRRISMIKYEWLCQSCLKNGIYKQAIIGDHIIPIKQDWDKRLDVDNIQPLCMECHNIKTGKEISESQ